MSVARVHHKGFLGMAAGVGKTYRMLQEGQRRARPSASRRDCHYLEPHGRAAAARPPTQGCDAVGAGPAGADRAPPELALIGELAHTNGPGTEHAKRYEDVAAVLGERIDVFSTVDVQHLESLNDQVAELTGVRVRETFPDSELSGADEVLLVDVKPPALIERVRACKVYKPDRVHAALNGFFRVENLAQRIVVAAAPRGRAVSAPGAPAATAA